MPKREFFGRFDYKTKGVLVVNDTTQQGLDRLTKVASFAAEGQSTAVLYDPHLVWANDERFVLTGFERKTMAGETVRFAQSWLCRCGWQDPPAIEEDSKRR